MNLDVLISFPDSQKINMFHIGCFVKFVVLKGSIHSLCTTKVTSFLPKLKLRIVNNIMLLNLNYVY